MRALIFVSSVLVLAGCASQAPGDAMRVASTTHASPATPASKRVAATNPYPGYKMKQKNGAIVYCKRVARVGTRFEDEYCMTESEMEQLEEKAQQDREMFRRNQTVCGAGTCGDDG
ncbi:MAG TPA: hypothetical protein VFI92_00710 [Steroidobacteraceae bacterium]|nr:hypothetical protein [Steroidobacteraceae bacterium]